MLTTHLSNGRRLAGLFALVAAAFALVAAHPSNAQAATEIGRYAPASVYCDSASNTMYVQAQFGGGDYYSSQNLAYRIWAHNLTKNTTFWLNTTHNAAPGAWTQLVDQPHPWLLAATASIPFGLSDGNYHVYVEYLWWSSLSNRWLRAFNGSLRTSIYGTYGWGNMGYCLL